jgi:hypothetical protein
MSNMMMPSVTFKSGVRTYIYDLRRSPHTLSVQPQIFHAITVAAMVYAVAKTPLVVTSLMDGKHSQRSLHYKGLAVDLRIWNLNAPVEQVVTALRSALGEDYDVVLESDHIHVEYDPEEKPNVKPKGRKAADSGKPIKPEPTPPVRNGERPDGRLRFPGGNGPTHV